MRFTTSVLFASGFLMAGTLAAAAWPATTRSTANVRGGPGTSYGLLGTLPAGTPVEVVGCSGAWCQTPYGYVSANLLAQAPGAAAASPAFSGTAAASGNFIPAPPPIQGAAALGYAPAGAAASYQPPVAAAGTGLIAGVPSDHPGDDLTMSGVRTTMGTTNVRSGPGTEYEVVKTLPDSTSVQVIRCADSWCQTDEGYISIYLLSRGPVQQVLNAAAQPRVPGSQARDSLSYGSTAVSGASGLGAYGGIGAAGAASAGNAMVTASANVRSGPGTRYNSLGTLPAGAPVNVVSCAGAWCQTQYGYVSARLIGQGAAASAVYGAPALAGGASPTYRAPAALQGAAALGYAPAGAAASYQPPVAAAGTGLIAGVPSDHPGDDLTMSGVRTTMGTTNVRSGPGTEYEVVKTLPDSTSVQVIRCADSWCQTDEGYISIYLLSRGPVQQVLNAAAQPRVPGSQARDSLSYGSTAVSGASGLGAYGGFGAAGAASAGNAVVTASANVRSGPGTRYDLLGTLPAGSPVNVVSCAGAWCQTQYGYVSARLIGQGAPAALSLQPMSAAPVAATPGRAYAPNVIPDLSASPAGATVTTGGATSTAITTASVKLRTGPGTNYDSVGTLPAGTSVELRGCSGSWCETVDGYVSARHLSTGAAEPARVVVRRAPARGPATQMASSYAAYGGPAVPVGYEATAPYAGPVYPGIAVTAPYAPGAALLAGLAAPFVGLAAAVDAADGGYGWGGYGTAPFGYGWGTVWRASWGPGYWGPGLYGRNGASYWGARTSYWGGRTSYANMHPGYPNIARFGDRYGDTYWSRRGEGRLPQRASFYGGMGPFWQGPYAEGPSYNGRPVMWRPGAAIW
ncbi:SH3 domain-containing protein [Ancylobacter sp. WKF20]|uniref:SH3 domain-containing protein n=1 Tax=Ancylobacter sp. WKF20 TaxID=3039801 RepID=UPI0024344D37|nr:SH3 domain-containing protein [Ancylobacter sp. WKF20]WGD31590.1 SH3 domain-containing protein [Ancylobacter sp. WKF20]